MDLTEYVKEVSKQDFFSWDFKHEAYWNNRLKTTGGRFFPKDGHLDFNPKIYQEHGIEIFRKIVRHELCHYHLYYQKKGYKHADKDFKELLKLVDGLRYVPCSAQKQAKYSYTCLSCGQVYQRQRQIDLKKYRCGKCHGYLCLQNRS